MMIAGEIGEGLVAALQVHGIDLHYSRGSLASMLMASLAAT